MGVATVTSKGQLTIPADVRAEYGIETGDQIEFVPLTDGTLHLRLMNAKADDFFNCLSNFENSDFVGTDDEAIAQALLLEHGKEIGNMAGHVEKTRLAAHPRVRKPAA